MTTPHLKTPLQRRSRETIDRILDAAARRLEDRSFQELRLADVVSEAGCSVGAFYHLFRDKEALLQALDERYCDEFHAEAVALQDSETLASGTLIEILQALAGMLSRFHAARRGLIRALILHNRVHSDPAFRSREEKLWEQVSLISQRLLRFRCELSHADPEKAIRFAFLQMLFSLREMALWPANARQVPVKGDTLARELARAAHAYLTAEDPAKKVEKKIRTKSRSHNPRRKP